MAMNRYKTIILLSISILVITASCSEKDESTEGDIIGYVFGFDEYGRKFEDHSGISIYTEPGRKYSAVTDINGRYVLNNVLNGTYNLSFEKEGFATMKKIGLSHLGGNETILPQEQAIYLFEHITTNITRIECIADTLLIADMEFSGDYKPWVMYLLLFYSTDEDFELRDAHSIKNYGLYNFSNMSYRRDNISKFLPFTTGQRVYCKAAIFSGNYASEHFRYYADEFCSYYDYESALRVYPNLSNDIHEFFFTMP